MISMPKHGDKYKGFALLDEDQARYIERKALIDRTNKSIVMRRAVDLLMRIEPLSADEPVRETAAS